MSLSAVIVSPPMRAHAQSDSLASTRNDSVTIRLVDVELRAAIQVLARYLDRPLAIGNVMGGRITLETPQPVPRRDISRLLRGMLEGQSIQLVSDSAAGMYRLETSVAGRPTLAGAATGGPQSRPSDPGGVQLFVIHLRHARAADVAATVNALYGRASSLGEIASQPQAPPRGDGQSSVGPPQPLLPVAPAMPRNASLGGDVTIIPDPRANSLLIRATRNDYTLIEAAVKEIDVRPLQVLIEVLIAEVRKDRGLNFGIDANYLPAQLRGSENTTVEGSLAGVGLGDFVLKVMGLGGGAADAATATLRSATSRGDATIVSRPVILAANNEEAEINVGSQRPFVSVSRVLPTDNIARDQVVTYKDVGTRLRVVPTISAEGYIMLHVTQEISAATSEQQFDAPVISTRSVQTKLLIKDGQTVVMGGLNDKQHEVIQSGIPLLSSLPLLGGLFGHASRRTTESELLLFITPRIIRDDADVDSLTDPLSQKAEKIRP
jgi:general secretion pathway protein D